MVLLKILIDTLKSSEEDGRAAIESLINLSEFQCDIFRNYLKETVHVVSEIASCSKFDDSTRASALDLIIVISQHMAEDLTKISETKDMLFPALLYMAMETDHQDSLDEWIADQESDEIKSGPSYTANNALSRLAIELGGQAIANLI